VSADPPLVGPVAAPDLHCMTLNLRRRAPHRRSEHPDRWSHRRDAVAALVTTEAPHVLAVQEAMPDQAAFVTSALGARWEPVLVGRGRRGTGERVGLVVDTERLRVVSRRSWALSRTPGRAGSRSWATVFARTAVGAVLQDRTTGVRFLALATHLDHLSTWARYRSAQLVAGIVRASGLPAVAMADGNAPAASAPHRVLREAGFVDTWDRASRQLTPAFGTYPHYGPPRVGARRIDWVLARPTDAVAVSVSRAAVSDRRPDGVWPSDHAAVHAVLRWDAR
jgi:endonuclease/exonuclease/phosphatase family metal-dependent hydrolase